MTSRPASSSETRPSGAGLVLGVTGHRALADVLRLEVAVTEVAAQLEARQAASSWTLLSGLAEGADRLVARMLVERGVRLIAVLPRSAAEFEHDFATDESRADFRALLARAGESIVMEAAGSRNDGYRMAGEYIVDRCDLLVALWDGRDPISDAGTGAMVARARAAGKPLAWIHAGNSDPATGRPVSLGDEQGLVTWERL